MCIYMYMYVPDLELCLLSDIIEYIEYACRRKQEGVYTLAHTVCANNNGFTRVWSMYIL